MKKQIPLSLAFLLAPLVFAFAIGQDIFIPEVPQLMKIFHTSQAVVQLTLSLFMLSVGAGQLIVGPISDHFGRKRVVLFSIALYVAGSLLAASAFSIGFLIAARIIEAIGACGMMVCAFAIVRDLVSGAEGGRIYSYLNGAIAVSPLLAPLAGGYLDVWFGWRAPFIALAVIGALIFIPMSVFLRETLLPSKRITFDLGLFKRYWSIIKNVKFLIYALAAASALASFFTFFSVSSYILINLIHIPETRFGFYFATAGIIFFFASIWAGRLCLQIGIYRVVLIGAVGLFVSGVWMALWTLLGGTTLASFLLPSWLTALSGAFLMGAGAAGALESFEHMAGTASAMLGAFQFLLATAVGSLATIWPVKSNMPYAIPLTVLGALVFLGLIAFRKRLMGYSRS